MSEKRTNDEGEGQQPSDRFGISRRSLVKTTAGAIGFATLGSTASGAVEPVSAQTADGELTFPDQSTAGLELTLETLQTPVDAKYLVIDTDINRMIAQGFIEAGEYTDYTISLNEWLTSERTLDIRLYDRYSDSGVAHDSATITVSREGPFVDGLSVTKIDANPDKGFNYPYFLYAPAVPEEMAAGPLLIEPNNTGTTTDDFSQHLEAARRIANGDGNGGSGRAISNRLGVPFLVPVFPRPRSEPVDSDHYVHMLDTDTMHIESGDLARVDLQLLKMADDARQQLSSTDYSVESGLLLNGFSASGNFVNRFAALHPEPIISVTAGGINGTPILPKEEAKGHTLNYQIGIADLQSLIGEAFDLEAFRDVNQLLYIGELDFNDTIGYSGTWSNKQEAIALDVYGPNMQRDRMPYSQSIYEDVGASAAFKIYDRVDHTPQPVIDDLVAFHRASLNGDDISTFNEPVRANPRDLDRDGVTEDVNGNGGFDIGDIQKLFNMYLNR